MSIAVFWFFVIAILKIAGKNKVGFFAGRLIRPPPAAGTDAGVEVVMENQAGAASNVDHEDHVQKSFNRRVIFVRLVFIICGILTIIASILFYTKGVAAFKNSINAMNEGILVSENNFCLLSYAFDFDLTWSMLAVADSRYCIRRHQFYRQHHRS